MNRLMVATTLGLLMSLAACGGGSGLGPGEERLSDDEAEHTAAMIEAIKAISLQRHPTGDIQRFNQSKTLGCFDGEFAVLDNLDTALQQGIFKPGARYPARLRFANATQEDDREKDFRGLSIKLAGVEGPSLWGEAGYQDFLFNSYPALFVANPGDFRDFIDATRDDKVWRYFLNPGHWYTLGVVMKGREKIDNPLAIPYWSTTPYRFGPDETRAVKYSVRPCGSSPDIRVEQTQHFLGDAIRAHLRQDAACLSFMVQFQQDPDAMPIEDASVIWEEDDSPFIKLAEIRIEAGMDNREDWEECNAMTFNPWQSVAAHRPVGGINRARKPIYAEVGEFRRRENRLRNGQ